MPISNGVWVPYPTADNPISWRDLPEWDSIIIAGVQLPIAELPDYSRKLSLDSKSGPGQDYYSITSKGLKPEPLTISLRLWVDYITGKNWLEEYHKLIPKISAPSIANRYAVSIYHPVLQPFGVTSVIFSEVPTPRHSGNRVFTATLQAVDARTQPGGAAVSKKTTKAPNTTATTTANQTYWGFVNRDTGELFGRLPQSQTIPTQQTGTAISTTVQARVNTPASRATIP